MLTLPSASSNPSATHYTLYNSNPMTILFTEGFSVLLTLRFLQLCIDLWRAATHDYFLYQKMWQIRSYRQMSLFYCPICSSNPKIFKVTLNKETEANIHIWGEAWNSKWFLVSIRGSLMHSIRQSSTESRYEISPALKYSQNTITGRKRDFSIV